MHQLIILGNGFDLTCGLKSKFSDFYRNRMNAACSIESILRTKEMSGMSFFLKSVKTTHCGRPIVVQYRKPYFSVCVP